MRYALLLTLAACSGPATDTPALEDNRLTLDDVDELLARVEALEAEVAALKSSGAPVGIDADVDGDGLREWDGLPVGTRRGEVLWEWACPEGADGDTEVSSPPPSWLKPPADSRLPWGYGCYGRHDDLPYGGEGNMEVHATMLCDSNHGFAYQCIAL